ncbi:MAG: SGNH/GDSL hydrolase family protein [Lachnospiraceae bacterium]|nr:SGNH/GDSL hydrolase family protein [Lachnospiraceae bacterium]
MKRFWRRTAVLLFLIAAGLSATVIRQNRELERLRKENERLLAPAEGVWQKLARGQEIRVLVIGDSIGAGTGASEGMGWAEQLKQALSEKYGSIVNVDNASLGATTSYAGYVQVMLGGEDVPYDLAIVCYGHNDDEKGFSREYESILHAIRSKYPSAAILPILESSQREYTAKIREIQDLSAHYGLMVSDMIGAFSESGASYESLTADGVHPNDAGYALYCDTLMKAVSARADSYEAYEKQETSPVNENMEEFDHFYYIPKEACIPSDDGLSLTIPFSAEMTGKPGLDLDLVFSTGITLEVDGNPFYSGEIQWTQGYRLHNIIRLGDRECRIRQSVTLRFTSREAADGFRGLVFTGVR